MTALFVKPLPFTVVTATADTLYPATNANMDQAGLVWRYTGTTISIIVDLGASLPVYDTIAVVGCNISGGNTVTITGGNSNTGTGQYTATTTQFPTARTNGFSAKYVHYDPALLTSHPRYVKIVITATSNADAWLQVGRIVIGQSVNAPGIDIDPEQTFVDQSQITEGPNFYQVDPYPTLPQWKVSLSWQSDAYWRSSWMPFFVGVGMGTGFLFVPSYEAGQSVMQTDACFGRMTANANGKHPAHNLWTAEVQMLGIIS